MIVRDWGWIYNLERLRFICFKPSIFCGLWLASGALCKSRVRYAMYMFCYVTLKVVVDAKTSDAHRHDDVAVAVCFVGHRPQLPRRLFIF